MSFKSDCVLKCMLRRFAFSISSVHIVSLIFKGGIDDLSMNVFKVLHQSLLLILWLDFNLLASLSKYDFLDDLSSVVVSFLSFLYLSQRCASFVRLALSYARSLCIQGVSEGRMFAYLLGIHSLLICSM